MANFVFIGVLIAGLVNAGSPTLSIYESLLQHIKDESGGPNPDLPPLFDTTHAITANVQMSVTGLYGVDRLHNEVSLCLMVAVSWNSGVTWTAKDFNDLSSFTVSRSFLWFPHIAVKNAISGYKDISGARTVLLNDGTAWTMHHMCLKVSCDLSSEDKCHVGLILSTHGNQLIHLKAATDAVKTALNFTTFFHENMDTASPLKVREGVVLETPYANAGVPGKKERVDFQFAFTDRRRTLMPSVPSAAFTWL